MFCKDCKRFIPTKKLTVDQTKFIGPGYGLCVFQSNEEVETYVKEKAATCEQYKQTKQEQKDE